MAQHYGVDPGAGGGEPVFQGEGSAVLDVEVEAFEYVVF
jgi:uncharacterized protein (DUF433 family)